MPQLKRLSTRVIALVAAGLPLLAWAQGAPPDLCGLAPCQAPEPGSWALVALAVGVAAWVRRGKGK